MLATTKANENDFPLYLFHQGKNAEAGKFFGAHAFKRGRGSYHRFRVWAPTAKSVSVIGEFNQWDRTQNPMEKISDTVWEVVIPKLKQFDLYKYSIETQNGQILEKSDPYAVHFETRPGTASKLFESSYQWEDAAWMQQRKKWIPYKEPMNIYEVHLGSWKHKEGEQFPSYLKFVTEIIPYLKKMSYTHVEFMPLTEYPFDGSWGYQVTGYFAPTSRHGTPDDFRKMVDLFHQANIGVILDWVPAHFPKDAHGLADFDGQALYEYADPRKGEHPDWGTKVFDYAKNEVSNFLIANALYWLDEYHIDGLRVDAVASMLYLDYGRQDGQWVPNKYGDNKNLEAIEFFKHLNSVIRGRKDGAIIIAEESTAWPNVTKSPEEDGLGFTFKWNMGWMHDFLEYMKLDPYFRKFNHNKMTFGITYCTSENFILVLSHDEVVHLKCSMINKMPGEYEDKFANLKVGYTFMLGHPGKKLLFMGQDFGQFHEWDEKVSLDWYLTKEPFHADLQNYVKGLLTLYHKYPALYRLDEEYDGFQWINANDGDRSIFSFIRRDETQKKNLLFICNFTPVDRDDYRVGVPKRGTYTLLLDQEHGYYKRGDKISHYRSIKSECDGQPYSFAYPLPAYGTAVFRFS